MRLRWLIVFVSIAALHFAATASVHLSAIKNCRPMVGPGCQTLDALATALSFPLLPILVELWGGGFGWLRAMVAFSLNSGLVAVVATGVAWSLSRWVSGGETR